MTFDKSSCSMTTSHCRCNQCSMSIDILLYVIIWYTINENVFRDTDIGGQLDMIEVYWHYPRVRMYLLVIISNRTSTSSQMHSWYEMSSDLKTISRHRAMKLLILCYVHDTMIVFLSVCMFVVVTSQVKLMLIKDLCPHRENTWKKRWITIVQCEGAYFIHSFVSTYIFTDLHPPVFYS